MIQDIMPHVFHNEYCPKQPEADDYVFVFCQNSILLKEDGGPALPRNKELDGCHGCQYLFCIGTDNFFLCMEFAHPEYVRCKEDIKCRIEKMSVARDILPKELCFAAYTAYHLYCWYRDNQFCGRCGCSVVSDKKERMLYCTNCGNQIYPKIAPAVIVAVTDGDRILLSKYAGREYKRYALIAGFTEIGETAEETVRREVMEEVGLRVKHIRYYKTQPWGIAGNLLIGYFADLDGEDRILLDQQELAVAEWMYRQDLRNMDDGFSLTREMMRVFSENREPV